MPQPGREERLRRYWDKHAGSYDKQMGFFERHLFSGSRDWVCSKATGHVLDVAIGTGLNLGHYPGGAQLTGLEWSPAMLRIARERAGRLGVAVDLRQGDAQALDFADASFDTVVCTFSLCAIPDDRLAVAEMTRVLRPGVLLLLADHVEGSPWYAPRRTVPDGGGQRPGRRRAFPSPADQARSGAGIHHRRPRPVQAGHRRTTGRPQAASSPPAGKLAP